MAKPPRRQITMVTPGGPVLVPDPRHPPHRQRLTGWQVEALLEAARRVFVDRTTFPRKLGDKEKFQQAIRDALDAQGLAYNDDELRRLLGRFYKRLAP